MGSRRTLEPFATEVLDVGSSAVGLSTDKYLLADRLIDGAFEIWTDANTTRYWTQSVTGTSTVDREGTIIVAGTYALKLTISATNQNASVAQSFTMIPGRYYTLDLYYRNSEPATTTKITIADSGLNKYLTSLGAWQTAATYITLANSEDVYLQYTLTFPAYGSYTQYSITIANLSAASSNIYVDSLRLVEANTQRAIFPEPAVEAFGVLETAQIRFDKSQVPTTVIGELLEAGQNYTLENFDDIRKFKAIRTGSTNGLLTVEYKR